MQSRLIIGPIENLVTVSPLFSSAENPLGELKQAALAVEYGLITWVGLMSDLPKNYAEWPRQTLSSGMLLPGLIDCHTHLVFAGDRANEFQQRLAGQTYQQIAEAGGGIRHTVEQTRAASEEELFNLACQRAEKVLSYGMTTLEAKSGYALTLEGELKSLRVLQQVNKAVACELIPTLMAAHDIPSEWKHDVEGYIRLICETIIPAVAEEKLAVFNDVFCDEGYFTIEQARQILECGLRYGLIPKIHAEEFTNQRATILACELGAASADHLLAIDDEGIETLVKTQGLTIPVLLPATAFFLGLKDYAPVKKMLENNLPVALATDFNPGSSNCQNILMVMAIACLQMSMPVDAVIRAVTIHAAKALRLDSSRGSIDVGKRADFALFDVVSPAELLYHWADSQVQQTWVAGQLVFSR